ncbi:hypothetical protein Metig_0952 [Methanotorris igneus Kol 5]|uniref:HesB/YadR/YfhF-family protein n=2 Tax=Methanotorris igneus TaxID=2189 RepID=F6BDD4_METIK|nr:hypothetical protein Metig_0952 [Methanotorris igneus Kol 5]
MKEPREGDELVYDGEFKIYLDKIAKEFLTEVNLILKRSFLRGEYLAVKGYGGGC